MATAVRTPDALPAERPERPHLAPRGGRGARRRPARPVAIGAALGLSALIGAGALFPAPALEIVGSSGGAPVQLVHSAAYVVLAPLCDVYDALTLLTLRQHAAVLLWLGTLYLALRAWRGRDLRRRSVGRVLRREIRLGLAAFALLVAFLAAGALVNRPMAALKLADADELSVDLHSHTSSSHDGRWGFDAEHNRAWHHAGGYDAVYVTDHRVYDGAEAGARGNPPLAGLGTVLLPGIETRAAGEHVNVLGVTAADSVDRGGSLDLGHLRRAHARAAGGPPFTLLDVPVDHIERRRAFPLDAIEGVDGAPRGLAFTRVHRAELLAAAHRDDAVIVSGSDHHGWGSTAAAWTVVRVPGWRSLTPARLDEVVRTALRAGDVRVVARTAPPPPTTVLAWLGTPTAVVWHLFAAAGAAERAAWLAWAWGLCVAQALLARRRRGRAAPDAARPAAA